VKHPSVFEETALVRKLFFEKAARKQPVKWSWSHQTVYASRLITSLEENGKS